MNGFVGSEHRPGFQKGSDLGILGAAVNFVWNGFSVEDWHCCSPVSSEIRRFLLLRLHVLGSLGFLSRRFEDQPRDFVGMGNQREMAGLQLDGLGAHPLGHEALEVRIDGAVFR